MRQQTVAAETGGADRSEPGFVDSALSTIPPGAPVPRPGPHGRAPTRRQALWTRRLRTALRHLRRGELGALVRTVRSRLRSGSPDAGFPFAWHLDVLAPYDPIAGEILVQGFVSVPEHATTGDPHLCHGARIPIARAERPEVTRELAGYRALGFRDIVTVPHSSDGWSLELTVDGRSYQCELPAPELASAAERAGQKARKLARIEPTLRCPRPTGPAADSASCAGTLSRDRDTLVCTRCATHYPATDRHFDLLSEELEGVGGVAHTENISSFGYDPWATEIIDNCAGGLVLDCGSGLRFDYRDDVVHFEIVDYPSTDVLGIGERLPFADDTFDAALSLSVLEHVRDPFRCAAEIVRVVRPGGTIYVSVPFLQPYHGYPHHYYNMTRQGLENLFGDRVDVTSSGTPWNGWPIFTLPYFLRRYVEGLPPESAARFRRMRVDDLLADPFTFFNEDFVTRLDESARSELAAVNYLIATKKPSSSA